jgi:predicted glycosyltransferase involved in capsule biosynthesis
LSVIVPYRADPDLPYLQVRMEEQCASFPVRDDIEFIVVDSGSNAASRAWNRATCERHGVRYLYHDSEGQTFSIGEARDFGVCHARGRAITFLDVDLRMSQDFWPRLLGLMASFGISAEKKRFFAVPCLYLTQEGTEEFVRADPATRAQASYLRWLDGDTQAIQNMAPCSSVMVVDRLHYLSVGGHRPEFRGHGYEDFELYHRLIGEEDVLPRAADYYTDAKSWDSATYTGFRAQFSLLGRYALLSNLFVIHLWHPRPKNVSFYGSMSVNRTIWLDFFKEFDAKREHPEPLVDRTRPAGKLLFFGPPRGNSARCLRDVFPLLGDRIYVSEQDFADDAGQLLLAEFEAMIRSHGVTRIVFPNPYGNELRLKIYQWCRSTGFPYLCFDRGALADSWFLDARGFNADSGSYARERWDRELSPDERAEAISYIRQALSGANTLEKQGDRIGGDALAARLQTGGKRVLFVPLQRPSDSVIRYFAGAWKTYDEFLRFIDDAAKELKHQGWIVLCKKHPLETESLPLQQAVYAPDDTHFIDLLELCHGVALVNSGVGVYAMMMGKPCFVFGHAFYAFEDVNQTTAAGDVAEFCRQLQRGAAVNMETVYRFVHYLKQTLYSFGRSRTKLVQEADGSMRNATTTIDFYEVRLPGAAPVIYPALPRPRITAAAPLFERFRLDLLQSAGRAGAAAGASGTGIREPKKRLAAKWAKLKRDPQAFFRDSKHAALRPLRWLFPRR